jgi:hypothetical protein
MGRRMDAVVGCGASEPRDFINEGLTLTSSREAWTQGYSDYDVF